MKKLKNYHLRGKNAIIVSIFALFNSCMLTHDIDTSKLELPTIGKDDYIIEYLGYTTSYNMLTKTPEWVAYELTAEELKGSAQRDEKFFRADSKLLLPQPEDYDYRGSGWTRGHMAPAADFRWSDDAMWETFLFTNCCPQDEDLNNGMWNTLEKKCRTWAKRYGRINIITGPIYDDNRFGSIGKGRVMVPDAFFKAILAEDGSGYDAIAFIMENKPVNKNLQRCAMSVDELESIIGLDLFPALDDSVEDKVEKNWSLKKWKL